MCLWVKSLDHVHKNTIHSEPEIVTLKDGIQEENNNWYAYLSKSANQYKNSKSTV
jgi:hypothetical protein